MAEVRVHLPDHSFSMLRCAPERRLVAVQGLACLNLGTRRGKREFDIIDYAEVFK